MGYCGTLFEVIIPSSNGIMSGARILEVTKEYTVIEKTGHKEETQELFEKLDTFGVQQFVRSGRIAVTKLNEELLFNYLKKLESEKTILD